MAAAALAALVGGSLGACTIGDPDATGGGPSLDLERRLDRAVPSDDEIGLARVPDEPDAYGLDAPTQDLCDPPDQTDAARVARVQHTWESDGWTTGELPLLRVSVELVTYEGDAAEAAIEALAGKPTECPTRVLDGGAEITFAPGDLPSGVLPESVAIRADVDLPEGPPLNQVIIGQRSGAVVGYLYVTGTDATVATEAARLSAILADRVGDLATEIGSPDA